MKVVGVISGTSYDAIETAATELNLQGDTLFLKPLGSRSFDYRADLRDAIADALPPAAVTAGDLCRLDTRLGQAFAGAAAACAAEFCSGRPDLVVSHGQTAYHWVEDGQVRGTLQLGQPAWISEKTGAPVVSDLRSRDVAAGGQGAPLVSLFDVLVLGRAPEPHAALNLGGIANLTVVPPEGPPLAFDVGPANALIDAAVQHFSGGEERMDRDGARARRGRVRRDLLERLLKDPYYEKDPPKSTGKEHFNLEYLFHTLKNLPEPNLDDLVATVTQLTVEIISRDCRRHGIKNVLVSGGGVHNPVLMQRLYKGDSGAHFDRIESLGIPSAAKEAYAFAVLGFLTLHGLPGNVPSCTGAAVPAVLGSITPGTGSTNFVEQPVTAPTKLRILKEDRS